MPPKRLLLLTAAAAMSGLSFAQDAKTVFAKSESSIVTIFAGDAQGTGFAIGDGTTILTCHHVIESDPEHIKIGAEDGPTAKLIANSANYDVAVLKVAKPLPGHLKLVKTPDTGSKIFVIGSPEGFEKSITEGIVSSVRKTEGIAFLQITAPISQGSSGSPILTETGEVVGMVQRTLAKGQGINFGLSSPNLQEVVDGKVGSTKFEPKEKDDASANGDSKKRYLSADGTLNVETLAADVFDESEKKRMAAIQAALEYGPSTIPEVLAYMDSNTAKYPEYDDAAAYFLRIFGAEGKPFLLKALTDSKRMKRLLAADTLSTIIANQLRKDEIDDKAPGYGDDPWALGQDIKAALLKSCSDVDEEVQISALYTCSKLKLSAVPHLGEQFLADHQKDAKNRGAVLGMLAGLESSPVVRLENLSDDLIGTTAKDASIALTWLKGYPTETSFQLVRYSLYCHQSKNDVDIKCRQDIAYALGGFETDNSLKLLLELKEDSSHKVQGSALASIGKVGKEAYFDTLVRAAKSGDPDISRGGIYGLGGTGSPKALDVLKSLAATVDKTNLYYILDSIDDLGDTRAISFVEKYLKDTDKEIRDEAKTVYDNLVELRDAEKKSKKKGKG